MIIGKINLGQSFEDGVPRWMKVDIDATPEPGETSEQVLDKIKQIIDGWQKTNNPFLNLDTGFGPGNAPNNNTPSPVINRAHERLMILIENAKTLAELGNYSKDVKAANDSRLSAFWSNKWDQMQNRSDDE